MFRSLMACALLFFATTALACFDIPKQITIDNSPFFFDGFSVSGHSLTFKGVNKNESFRLRCSRDKDSKDHTWHVDVYEGDQKKQSVDLPGGGTIGDSEEIPVITEIDLNQGSRSGARGQIRMKSDSSRWLEILCEDNENSKSMSVEHRAQNVEGAIGSVRARSAKNVRSISRARAQQYGFDFESNDPSQLELAGCGTQINQTGGSNGQQN